jgi:hypothetical protein
MLPLLYVVRMDVDRAYLDEFVKWYDTRHGPDLIGTGFYSCSAYHARVGGPFICNIYEIPDLGIFSSKAYVDVRTRDRQLTEEVLHKISNHSNTIYRQEAVVGLPDAAFRPDSRPSRAGAVCAPVVATLRLDIEPVAFPDFRAWFLGAQAADAAARPGFLRSRLARQDGKHPLFPSKQAEWLVLTEWASMDDALAAGSAEEVLDRYGRQAEKSLSRLEYNIAALSATLLNANAWAA